MYEPADLIDEGSATDLRLSVKANAYFSITSTLFPAKVSDSMPEFIKALAAIYFTFLGMVMLFS